MPSRVAVIYAGRTVGQPGRTPARSDPVLAASGHIRTWTAKTDRGQPKEGTRGVPARERPDSAGRLPRGGSLAAAPAAASDRRGGRPRRPDRRRGIHRGDGAADRAGAVRAVRGEP